MENIFVTLKYLDCPSVLKVHSRFCENLIYDVTDMITNKLITQIVQYRKKSRKFGDLIKYSVKGIFFVKNHAVIESWKLVPDLFFLSKNLHKTRRQNLYNIYNIDPQKVREGSI